MERVEYTVDTIGSNTLGGMLCRKGEDGNYTVDKVAGKEVVVRYTHCHMSHTAFANELHTLYKRGAVNVLLEKQNR